jgi:pilus assembly protein CpaE
LAAKSHTHLLLVSQDPLLRTEVSEALSGASRDQTVVHPARDLTRAVDLARDISPDVALVEMNGDLDAIKVTVHEILAVSPQTVVAGVYRPDAFPPEVWEQTSQGAIFVETLRAGMRDYFRRPISADDLRQLLARVHEKNLPPALIGSTVSFISNKGGVGKSTLAVNVASRLAQRHPGDVLLIDASLQMGVCAPMLDLRPQTTLLDAVRERMRLDTTLLRQITTAHPCGLDLLAAPPDPIAASEIDDELFTRVLNLARRTYRYVVIDTFPLFDRIVMSVLDASNLTYVVVDNVVPTVLSAANLVKLLDGLSFPVERQRLAVNRFNRVAGNASLEDIARALNQAVSHRLPFSRRAITAANVGRPFALTPWRWSGLERGLRGIVTEIEQLNLLAPPELGDHSGVSGTTDDTAISGSNGAPRDRKQEAVHG